VQLCYTKLTTQAMASPPVKITFHPVSLFEDKRTLGEEHTMTLRRFATHARKRKDNNSALYYPKKAVL